MLCEGERVNTRNRSAAPAAHPAPDNVLQDGATKLFFIFDLCEYSDLSEVTGTVSKEPFNCNLLNASLRNEIAYSEKQEKNRAPLKLLSIRNIVQQIRVTVSHIVRYDITQKLVKIQVSYALSKRP